MNNLTMIDIALLEPHPDNPRKDVGDVTELADSIRHSGIMQNLTVVPHEGRYRVIIGHRRLAAAKTAGLAAVPCIVSGMDYKEQLATMLCENMQRVDLTICEQASGIQMCLDLGESVKDIADKTGFSETTVRKRAKLSALPADKLKEAENRGGTLEEYLKCLEITDEGKRNELLENVGTKDFLWKYNSFIGAQKKEANLPLIRKEIEKLAKPLPDGKRYSSEYSQICSVNLCEWTCGTELIPNYDENETYYYYFDYSQMIVFQKVKKKKAQPAKKSKKEIEADRRRSELSQLTKKAYKMRYEFIFSFSAAKKYEKIINEYLLYFAVMGDVEYTSQNLAILKKAVGDESQRYYPNAKEVESWLKDEPCAAAVSAYYFTGDSERNGFYNAQQGEDFPVYNKNGRLEKIYEFLSRLGSQRTLCAKTIRPTVSAGRSNARTAQKWA